MWTDAQTHKHTYVHVEKQQKQMTKVVKPQLDFLE